MMRLVVLRPGNNALAITTWKWPGTSLAFVVNSLSEIATFAEMNPQQDCQLADSWTSLSSNSRFSSS
jgi:hypothetical protein